MTSRPKGFRNPATIRGRLKATKAVLGDQPAKLLEKPAEVLCFKTAYRKSREVATVNRALSTLRAAINWGRFQDPPYLATTPFHRFGVTTPDRHSRSSREGRRESPHSVRLTRTPGARPEASRVSRPERLRVRISSWRVRGQLQDGLGVVGLVSRPRMDRVRRCGSECDAGDRSRVDPRPAEGDNPRAGKLSVPVRVSG